MRRSTPVYSASNIKALTKSDTDNFDPRPRGIIVGTGVLVLVNDDDTTTTIATGVLAVGVVHNLSPKRINSTSTTATVMYGVY